MTSRNYRLLTEPDQLKKLVDKIGEGNRAFGLDCETGYSGPDRIKGSLDVAWADQFIAGFSLSGHSSWACYIPVRHDFGPNMDEATAYEIVKPLFETGKPVSHHHKFERKNFLKVGIDLAYYADSMLESYVLAETRFHGLKSLVKTHFDHEMTKITDLFEKATEKQLKCLRFNILELTPEVVAYACEDAAWCLALHEMFAGKVEAERKFIGALEDNVSSIVCDMERMGVAVDWEGLTVARGQAESFTYRFELYVKKLLGSMVNRDLLAMNLRSSKQMYELLYHPQDQGGLGLTTTRMTKGSAKTPPKMSTDGIALKALADEHVGIKKLLEYREVMNLSGRIGKWLDEYHFGADDRAHPNYNQAAADLGEHGAPPTGRFSADDPAIQQLPKKWYWTTNPDQENDEVNGVDYWSGNFRDFIIAGEGNYLLTFDYSQQELRMLAGLSQEPALLNAYARDEDVHALTAALMLGVPVEEIDAEKRQVGKTQNFAIVYGMGEQSLSERLGVSRDRAKELYASYFAQFPRVTTWIEKQKRECARRGYAETHFGRKVSIWQYESDNKMIFSQADRAAANYPIQGSAADMTKIAMVRAANALKKKGWWMKSATMIMNQHDSLSFEVSNDINPQEIRELLDPCVSFPIKNFPPFRVDWELGQRWGSSTKWKDEPVVFDGLHWTVDDGKVVESEGSKHDPEVQTANDPSDISQAPSEEILVDSRAYPEPTVSSEGFLLHIEVPAMPTQDQFAKFVSLVSSSPGSNTLKLITPEGEVVLPTETSLSVADQPAMSLALGGAKVFSPVHELDTSSLAEGLEL